MPGQLQWTILDVEEEEWDAVVDGAPPDMPAPENDCQAATQPEITPPEITPQ